jgi:hypothetical protein
VINMIKRPLYWAFENLARWRGDYYEAIYWSKAREELR